jgi:hypothetical protein
MGVLSLERSNVDVSWEKPNASNEGFLFFEETTTLHFIEPGIGIIIVPMQMKR